MALTSFTKIETTTYKDVDLDSTGELLAAGTPTLFGAKFDNTANTSAVYVKIYDKITAPTDADTPAFILKIPASGTYEFQPNMGLGRKFTAGLGMRCVTEAGTAGTTSPTNDVTATVKTS